MTMEYCRLCAEPSDCRVNIFTDIDQNIIDLIRKYLSVKMEPDDSLPVEICLVCRGTLVSFEDFAIKCSNSQAKLESLSKEKNNKSKTTSCADPVFGDNISTKDEVSDSGNDYCNDEDFVPEEESTSKRSTKNNTSIYYMKSKNVKIRRKAAVAKYLKELEEKKKSNASDINLPRRVSGRKIKLRLDSPHTLKSEFQDNITIKDEDVSLDNEKIFYSDDVLSVQHRNSKINKSANRIKDKKSNLKQRVAVSKNLKNIKDKKESRDPDFGSEPKKLKKSTEKPLRIHKTRTGVEALYKFICHICSKEFAGMHVLQKHTRQVHSTTFSIPCICGTTLTTKSSVYNHLMKHLSGEDFRCKGHCDKIFTRLKDLDNHYKELPTEYYPYTCEQCNQRFINAKKLKSHQEKHLPFEVRCKHTCEICGSKFITSSSLKTHIDVDHKNVNHSVCDICGLKFRTLGNLKNHRLSHSSDLKFQCPKCPKRLKTKVTLKKHIDCHSDTSYKCPKCSAILNSQQTLRHHMLVHEDVRRYMCALCNKTFKRRNDLNCHFRRHTGFRPYSCQWCPSTFADNSNFRDHKKNMHKKELAEYEATHGDPVSKYLHKNDGLEKDRKVYEISPLPTPTNTIVVGDDLVKLGASEYLKLLRNN